MVVVQKASADLSLSSIISFLKLEPKLETGTEPEALARIQFRFLLGSKDAAPAAVPRLRNTVFKFFHFFQALAYPQEHAAMFLQQQINAAFQLG